MTVYVCPTRDIECGDNVASWCAACPKRRNHVGAQLQLPSANQLWQALRVLYGDRLDAAYLIVLLKTETGHVFIPEGFPQEAKK